MLDTRLYLVVKYLQQLNRLTLEIGKKEITDGSGLPFLFIKL